MTSNSQHNSSKTASSSSNAPQASYADIARMATLNMSTNPVLNISHLTPSMINPTAWPTVASSKLNAETDKLPNEHYPSLDELHTDRKSRQHNFVQQGTSHSLDKSPSPTISKVKTENSIKKIEAQEDTIIKVVKYVQEIEKMHQNQSEQDSKQSSNNSSPVSSETTPTNPLPSKLPEPTNYSSPPDTESNNGENNSGKEFSISSKNNGPRMIRKSHTPIVQNPREFTPSSSQLQMDEARESKKVQPSQPDEPSKLIANPSQSLLDEKDGKKVSGMHNTTGSSDTVDSSKTRMGNSVKSVVSQARTIEAETIRIHKPERILKNIRDPQHNHSKDSMKVSIESRIFFIL